MSGLDAKDIRKTMPRFAPDTYAANLRLLPPFEALAAQAGCTPAQLALAWLLAQGPDVIPIPGTTSLAHLEEDLAAADLSLPADVIAQAGRLIHAGNVTGHRYAPATVAEIDTEEC